MEPYTTGLAGHAVEALGENDFTSLGQGDLSLLQVPQSEWDLDSELDLLGPPLLAPPDARLQPVGQDEDFFQEQLAKHFSSSSPSSQETQRRQTAEDDVLLDLLPPADDPLASFQRGAGQQDLHSRAEQAAGVRAKNRAAQRKSRARKKEKEREVEDQVQALTTTLRSSERHKRFLQRSNWLLTTAASEVVLRQPVTSTFVPADSLAGINNPRAAMELREGFAEPLRLSPAQFVGLQMDQLQGLWQSIAAAMLNHLPTATRQPDSEAMTKLERLQREVSGIVTFTALGNTRLCTRWLAKPFEQGNMGFWVPVAASLEATDRQRDRLRDLLAELTQQTEQLSAAEQHLLNAVKARGDGVEIGRDPTTGETLAELLEHVQADLCRVLFDYHAQVWAFTLSPVQVAICTVRAAPACPDLISIARALAGPSAQGRLTE